MDIERKVICQSRWLHPGPQDRLLLSDTVALLGQSGASKSSLINRLAGEALQRMGAVRDSDHRGRHVTTHRQLIMLSGGGLVVDTPGMRELQLWDGGEGVSETLADIESLAAHCRFADCTHGSEPGCAVLAAMERGELTVERVESYHKLQRELAYEARRHDALAQAKENRR